jgi:hypothetical protein
MKRDELARGAAMARILAGAMRFQSETDESALFFREAARCRRLAEQLSSASDRETMHRLAAENEERGHRAQLAQMRPRHDDPI